MDDQNYDDGQHADVDQSLLAQASLLSSKIAIGPSNTCSASVKSNLCFCRLDCRFASSQMNLMPDYVHVNVYLIGPFQITG